MQIGASVCRFKREDDGKWEYGIAVCESPGSYDVYHIIDMNGKCLEYEELWKYEFITHYGTLVFIAPEE